jgi:hypothetical protein
MRVRESRKVTSDIEDTRKEAGIQARPLISSAMYHYRFIENKPIACVSISKGHDDLRNRVNGLSCSFGGSWLMQLQLMTLSCYPLKDKKKSLQEDKKLPKLLICK